MAAESNALLIWLLAGGGGLLAVVAIAVAVLLVVNSGGGNPKSSGGGGGGGGDGGGVGQIDDAKPRMIKWGVPHKVGQRRKVIGSHSKIMTSPNPEFNKSLAPQNERVEFEGEIITLAVDKNGRATKVEVLVNKFVNHLNKFNPQPIAAGTRLIATMNGPIVTYQTKDGLLVQANLLQLNKYLHMWEGDIIAGDGPLFGVLESRSPGSTWQIDNQLLVKEFNQSAKGLFTIGPNDISGQAKFVGIVKQGNREYFDQEFVNQIRVGRQDAKIFIIKSAQLDVTIKARFPADYSTGPILKTIKSITKADYEMVAGHPLAGQPISMDSIESFTEETTFLDAGNPNMGGRKGKGR